MKDGKKNMYVCDLLVLVGYSGAAHSEQGKRNLAEHDCIKVFE